MPIWVGQSLKSVHVIFTLYILWETLHITKQKLVNYVANTWRQYYTTNTAFVPSNLDITLLKRETRQVSYVSWWFEFILYSVAPILYILVTLVIVNAITCLISLLYFNEKNFQLILVYTSKLSIAFVGWCSSFGRSSQGYFQLPCLHRENDEARFEYNFPCSSDAAYYAVWCWAGR